MEIAAGGRDGRNVYELGRDVYNYRCYFCHGYSGDGKTLASTYLSPPPRNFTATSPDELSRDAMLHAVKFGKENTAMKGFEGLISDEEIEAVVDFVRKEFMSGDVVNTRYHTAANGWPDHGRYAVAFPFVTGELALDTPWEALTDVQQQGRRLFMSSCVTCHDRATVKEEGEHWRRRSISFPRGSYQPGDHIDNVDGVSSASPYGMHDIPPNVEGMSEQEKKGEVIFQKNCAFCHGADGTGKNWIGSFLASPPRDLTNQTFIKNVDQERLEEVISEGIENTTMSAWKYVLTPEEISSVAAYVLKAFREQ